MTPYEILGVSPSATPEEMKAAHRALAKKYHPDVCREDGAENRLKEINAAYDQVKDGGPQPSVRGSFDDFVAYARHQAAKSQADVRAMVELSLEDAFTGRKVQIGQHEIEIPAGVNQNASFVISGAGRVVEGVQGDLLIGIRVRPHNVFERHFNDLYVALEIDAFDAMKGCEIDITGLGGEIVTMKIPAGCQSGQHVAVSDKGMSIPYSDGRGYMVGVMKVNIPTLSAEQVDKIKEILR